jgi:hypothetical protein
MKGAIADPSVRTISVPNSTRNIIIGASHHFFRTLRKTMNSFKIESFDIKVRNILIMNTQIYY